MTRDRSGESLERVAIVGAGPTGLSLALGLARHGVRSVLLEQNPGPSRQSKAPGIHVRTREVFRDWGIEEGFLAGGTLLETLEIHRGEPGRPPLACVDFSEVCSEADRPGILILEQSETERLLLKAVKATGLCDVRFGTEAVGVEQRTRGVNLTVRGAHGEGVVEAAYLVGCDGASSFVREVLGLSFDGHTYPLRPLLADIRIDDARDEWSWPRMHHSRGGMTTVIRLRPHLWRIIRLEAEADQGDEVRDDEVMACVREVLGEGAAVTTWASRFRIHRRSSPRFRVGRVPLAGDAAHVHSPVGGQGMNGGIQDAHNLAWKLAAALRGGEADPLLDSYEVERQAVIVEEVSRFTDVVTRTFLQTPAPMRSAAFMLFRGLLRIPPARRRLLRRMTMIDLDYPSSPLLDSGDRAAGRRLPNPFLRCPDGSPVRLYDLLPVGPAMLDVAQTRPFAERLPVPDFIRVGPGGYSDASGLLPALLDGGEGVILVRPDLHVAWARSGLEGIEAATLRALGVGAAGD